MSAAAHVSIQHNTAPALVDTSAAVRVYPPPSRELVSQATPVENYASYLVATTR